MGKLLALSAFLQRILLRSYGAVLSPESRLRATLLKYLQDRVDAENPQTPARRLQEIANQHKSNLYKASPFVALQGRAILKAVAGNPNTSPETLVSLLVSYTDAVLANPIFPLCFLEQADLLVPVASRDLRRLLARADLPGPLVGALASHPDTALAWTARQHVALAGDLAPADWEREVHAAIMTLPVGDRDLLEELHLAGILTGWLEGWVARTLAEQEVPRPEDTLPPAPTEESSLPPVSCYPEQESERLRAARDYRTSPELLSELVTRGSVSVRLLVARNPAAPPEALQQLYRLTRSRASALKRNGDLLRAVASHPHTPPDVLRILSEHRRIPLASLVADNPATPDALLRRMAKDWFYSVRGIARRAAAQRASFGETEVRALVAASLPMALQQAARVEEGTLVRLVALQHSSNAWYFRDVLPYHWEDRLAAALNPAVNGVALRRLAKDGIRPVRAAARIRLQQGSRLLSLGVRNVGPVQLF